MQPEERQHRISEYLLKAEFASLEEIAKQVDASISTIRRDLTLLEASGNIRRTHGGARIVVPRTDEFTFSAREAVQVAKALTPETIIPIHYEGWKHFIEPRAQAEKEFLAAGIQDKVQWLPMGEPLDVEI